MARVRNWKLLSKANIWRHVIWKLKKSLFSENDILYSITRDALQGCGYGNAVQKALEEKGVKADHHFDGDILFDGHILDVLCPKPTPPPPPPGK